MRKRILILDDDTALLEIFQIILNESGYDAILIAQTDDLLSLVRLHKPVLIILDYRLNGWNGGEWCAKLKAHPEFRLIPVMILTACTAALKKGSFGCDDFMTKPFDLYEILEHIEQLIDQADLLKVKSSGFKHLNSKPNQNSNQYDRY